MTDRRAPKVGELYRDNDPRLNGSRVVKVVHVDEWAHQGITIEVVEHWNEYVIGRQTRVNGDRLANSAHLATGYTRVSH